jgi:F0F1-type ATP synthase membrane subunit a
MTSPLSSVALFHLGPVPITTGVMATWAIMALLVIGGILVARRLSLVPSASQAALELIVDAVDNQIRDTMRVEPAPTARSLVRYLSSSLSPTGRRWCRASNSRRPKFRHER